MTRTYHMPFGWRQNAFIWREPHVGNHGSGFSGLSRAGMEGSFSVLLYILILDTNCIVILIQLLVHIIQKIHNFFHGNGQLLCNGKESSQQKRLLNIKIII